MADPAAGPRFDLVLFDCDGVLVERAGLDSRCRGYAFARVSNQLASIAERC
jgi:beta-phosphoglucomutase-like phosphatase (HAD superfamily)